MELFTSFFQIDFPSLFISFFLIIEISKWTVNAIEFCGKKFGIEFRWLRKQNEDHELLHSTTRRLSLLENQRDIDVEESIRHDRAIKEDLSKVTAVVEQIIDKLDIMEAKNDASELAKLKDRIAQAYRKYHEAGKWTRMDKESYEGLIQDYEAHGGSNSFVHTICEPESFTWEIVDE